MHKNRRTCTVIDSQYQQVQNFESFNLNEYDFQLENGVLNALESQRSYTYSFYPDSSVKKDIFMNFYQRPVYNWKLECELTKENYRGEAI